MSNIFAGMDLPEYGGTGDLSQADVQKIMKLRGALQSVDNGASRYWYDPSYTDLGGGSLKDWQITLDRGMTYGQGDGGENAFDSSKDKYTISRPRLEAEEGNLGDRWDETGKYQGTYSTEQHGWKDMMQAIALMGGGYLGGTYLSGLNGTGTAGLSGLDAAMLDAGAGATNVGSAGGLSGGLSGLDAAMLDAGAGATNVGAGAVSGSTPGWLSTAKDLYTGAGEFLNSGWGKALTTGAGLALTKNAKQGPADPMLANGAAGLTGIADQAKDRAKSSDALFNSQFLPRYMEMMGRADQRDQELYNFNMGRARLAAGQMDKYYSMVDAYDNESAREKAAGEAMAAARQSNSANAGMMKRRMASMGVNPASGAWGAAMGQLGTRSALNEALAANMARDAAKKEGLNMRATAAGLRGADAMYAGNALQGSTLGMGALGSGQAGVNANNANWNATMGLGAGALGQLGGWGLSRSNSADQLSAANTAGWNGLIGYGLGALWNSGTKGP